MELKHQESFVTIFLLNIYPKLFESLLSHFLYIGQ